MNCENIREQLLDAVETPAPAELQAHLDSCAACAARLAELRQTMAMLDEWQAPEVSPYFDSRLHARLREQQQAPARGWLGWIGLKPAAAALALLVVLGIGLLNNGPAPSPDAAEDLPAVMVVSEDDSAVADLQTLDANEELLADFELLDRIEEHSNGS